jgi:hypothetical protein
MWKTDVNEESESKLPTRRPRVMNKNFILKNYICEEVRFKLQITKK